MHVRVSSLSLVGRVAGVVVWLLSLSLFLLALVAVVVANHVAGWLLASCESCHTAVCVGKLGGLLVSPHRSI